MYAVKSSTPCHLCTYMSEIRSLMLFSQTDANSDILQIQTFSYLSDRFYHYQ